MEPDFFPRFLFSLPHFFAFWRIGGARLILVTVDTFDTPKRHEKPKTLTVSRMAIPTRPIPVTVDTFNTPKRHEKPKTITVSRMATPTRPILVTVDTFDTPKKRCEKPKTTRGLGLGLASLGGERIE